MLSPPGSARRPWHSAPKEGHANHSFLRGPWRLRCNRPECVNAAVVGAGGDLEALAVPPSFWVSGPATPSSLRRATAIQIQPVMQLSPYTGETTSAEVDVDATENGTGATMPVRLVAVNQAGAESVARIPPDMLCTYAPDGVAIDTNAYAADETDPRDLDKILAALRGGDSGQTYIGVAGPSPCPDAFGSADADGD